jgi:hypothetical protein
VLLASWSINQLQDVSPPVECTVLAWPPCPCMANITLLALSLQEVLCSVLRGAQEHFVSSFTVTSHRLHVPAIQLRANNSAEEVATKPSSPSSTGKVMVSLQQRTAEAWKQELSEHLGLTYLLHARGVHAAAASAAAVGWHSILLGGPACGQTRVGVCVQHACCRSSDSAQLSQYPYARAVSSCARVRCRMSHEGRRAGPMQVLRTHGIMQACPLMSTAHWAQL